MTTLTCGCTIYPSDDDSDDLSEHYSATWQQFRYGPHGQSVVTCYGTLCDYHLPQYYEAVRCKLGGGPL